MLSQKSTSEIAIITSPYVLARSKTTTKVIKFDLSFYSQPKQVLYTTILSYVRFVLQPPELLKPNTIPGLSSPNSPLMTS